jgi:hypothetical protein
MRAPVLVRHAPDVLIVALVHVERRVIRHVVHIHHARVVLAVQVVVEGDVIPVADVRIRVPVNAIKHAQHIAQIHVTTHVLLDVPHTHHVAVEPTVALRVREPVLTRAAERAKTHVRPRALEDVKKRVAVDVLVSVNIRVLVHVRLHVQRHVQKIVLEHVPVHVVMIVVVAVNRHVQMTAQTRAQIIVKIIAHLQQRLRLAV